MTRRLARDKYKPKSDEVLHLIDIDGESVKTVATLFECRRGTIIDILIAAGRNPDGSKPEQPKPTLPSYKASDSTYRANYVGGRDFVGRLPGWGGVA